MQKKVTKIILYIAFLVMLLMAGYVIFFSNHMISNKYYFLITAAAFALVCAVFVILIIRYKKQDKKSFKLMIIICIVLIVFQVVTILPVNHYSQTLPVWPRGTIYQLPGFRNSIAQNEVGLMMRYYLDGKTLYANEDYPIESHNGFLFITDEYEFVKKDYPVLTNEESEAFYNKYDKRYRTISVQNNPKLLLDAFKIHLYVGDESEIIILTDEAGSWYFMSLSMYEEAFGE